MWNYARPCPPALFGAARRGEAKTTAGHPPGGAGCHSTRSTAFRVFHCPFALSGVTPAFPSRPWMLYNSVLHEP